MRVLIVSNEAFNTGSAHLHSARWFRVGENDEMLDGLQPLTQARFYGGAVLGMPRQLLSMARPNLVEDPLHCRPNFWNTYYRAPNIAENLGSLRARLAVGGVDAIFSEFDPKGSATPADVRVYSPATRDAFAFTGPRAQPDQLHYVRRLAQLCRERGTRLVFLHTPVLSERGQTVISEIENWPEVLNAPADIVGIPPAKMFAGIADEDVSKLFYEDGHLNQNGQNLFTPLVTPTLIEFHGTSTNHP